MSNKKNRFLKLCAVMTLVVVGVIFISRSKTNLVNEPSLDNPRIGTANPAAVYCQEMGYEHKIVTDPSGSQHGVCCFPGNCSAENKEPCTSWDFLKGKCGQKYSYCAKQGWDIKTLSDGRDPFSPEYAVCVSKETQQEVGSITQLMKLIEKSSKGKISPEPEKITPKLENNSPRTFKTLPQEISSKPLGDSPSSFDWRNYNSSDWTTAVKDQGSCGACWSFSAVGVSEAVYNIGAGNPDLDLNLSEQYLVSDCHTDPYNSPPLYQNCLGGWENTALEYIRDSGVPDESCMSYVDGTSCTYSGSTCLSTCSYRTGGNCSDRTCSDRCADWASRLTQIDTVGTVAANGVSADREAMKQYLREKGPLSVAFDATGATSLGSDYWYWDDTYENIVYYCVAPSAANHAVVITGYDDNHGGDGFWIVKNSWGDDWGWDGNGYMKIIYGSCLVESSGVYYAEVTPTVQTWYLAEGFTNDTTSTYILIQNPNDTTANLTITYMIEGADNVTEQYSVEANKRYTIYAANDVGLGRGFSTEITSDQSVIVERAMYFTGGGHASIGVSE